MNKQKNWQHNIFSRFRLNTVFIILIFILIIIIARLFSITVLSPVPINYNKNTNSNNSFIRGNIYDRNKNLLAISIPTQSLFLQIEQIKDEITVSKTLAKILNIPYDTILTKIRTKQGFYILKRKLSEQEIKNCESLNLPGVYLKKEYSRFYPNKNIAGHLLGFCDIDQKGIEGIEKSLNNELIPPRKNNNTNSLIKGNDVYLTIDLQLQYQFEKALLYGYEKEMADSVNGIILDAVSGEILAIANKPDFDPNLFYQYSQNDFRNQAIFKAFEPGSVLKVFALAALLDKNKLTESILYNCSGKYTHNDVTINCQGIHGDVTYPDIIKYSCNSGMVQAAQKIDPRILYTYLKKFGFGTAVDINLPGENPGVLRRPGLWSFQSMLSIPIGQEISVTALQIAQAATAFSNNGHLVVPKIIHHITDQNEKILFHFKRTELRSVISELTAKKILTAMSEVMKPGGTGQSGEIEGFDVAGKSGTGQIIDPETGKYSKENFSSSLLTVFPAQSPKYIVYIVFHYPKGKIKFGGFIVSPVFKEIAEKMVLYYNIY